MTDSPEYSTSDEPAQTVLEMREPPGRLGSIVRRLKRMQPVPPPRANRQAGHDKGTS